VTLRISPAQLVARAEQSSRPGPVAKALSWPRVRLGDIARIVNGAPYPSSMFNIDGIGMPLIRIRDLYAEHPSTWYSGPWDKTHLVRHGDILVGMDGDFNLATWKSIDGLLNQRVCRVEVTSADYDARFLAHVLPGYLNLIWDATSSTTVKHLSSRSISDIPLPNPPLSEQRRIVDILEDHLSRLDAANDSLDQAASKVVTLASHSLHRLFNSTELPSVQLGDVVSMGSGGTPAARVIEYYDRGEIPWVNSGELKDSILRSVRGRITPAGLSASSAKWVPEGAVLIAMYGATIGRLGITTFPVTTNQAIAYLIPSGSLNRDYLYWYLFSQRAHFVRAGKGGAQPNISQTILKAWPIQIPSQSEQARIALAAAEAFDLTLRLVRQQLLLKRRSLALHRALLAAAFRGQLTGRTAAQDSTPGFAADAAGPVAGL